MPSPQKTATSRLEQILSSGGFAVTCELDSRDSADPQAVLDRARVLDGVCDAINVTDAAGAHAYISSVAACALLSSAGREVVLQMSCRDRNRIAMQGELLGASALGIRNVLCLTGDGVGSGDHPEAKPVFDLDSISLLEMARTRRDRGTFLSGRRLSSPPDYFLGAVENPFAPPFDFRPLRLARKIAAGVQSHSDAILFRHRPAEHIFELCASEPAVSKSLASCRRRPDSLPQVGGMDADASSGVHIPDAIIERIKGVPRADQQREGIRICVEIIQQIREMPGVKGIHLMAYRHEEVAGEILEAVGLLPRRGKERSLKPRCSRS